MKKLLVILALSGMVGSVSAATWSVASHSSTIIVKKDDPKKKKEKKKKKSCCSSASGATCTDANKGKSGCCTPKPAQSSDATSTSTPK